MPETIPPAFLADLLEFLKAEKTGQVVLHVVRGVVKGIDCNAMRRERDIVAPK